MTRISILLLSVVLSSISISQILPLPPRTVSALSGSACIDKLIPLTRDDRENEVFLQVMSGNVPDFLRKLVPVTSATTWNGISHTAKYYVTPDYIAIGSDSDYFLTPLSPLLGQRLTNAMNCSMPTKKMVDAIYLQATVKLRPQPIPPSGAMITVPVFKQHNDSVRLLRSAQLSVHPLGELVGGHKKDVIISNKIYMSLKPSVPKPVVIYGWHQLNGVPIQPVYNGHEQTYADYSHGIRLVQNAMTVDDTAATILSVLADTAASALLSDEGAIAKPYYSLPTYIEGLNEHVPSKFRLEQNFPNPFNPTTTIRYQVPIQTTVIFKVFDVLGHELVHLMQASEPAEEYSIHFDGTELASGVYIYQLSTEQMSSSRIMMLLK